MFKMIAIVLIAELFMVGGHTFFKKSVNAVGSSEPLILLRYPPLWVGILSMCIGLFCWLSVLKDNELNVVYSLGSMQYILILLSAHFFLGEKIDATKIMGTISIILGVILVVSGK